MIGAPALSRVDPTQSADEVARALVELFEAIETIPLKVSWVQRETERRLVGDGCSALAAAARAIAQAIDADAGLHDARPYHSRQHFCEVMLSACVLCQLHGLRGRSTQFLLLAALIHDFEHDGRSNHEFRLERASVARATPYLVAAGVSADARERLAALVLATEPHHGVRAAVLAREFHATGVISPPRFGDPAELRLLTNDAELSHLAMLLCEADVLPSVGLTLNHALRLQQMLATEWGRHLGSSDKLAFIDDVLSAGVIGPFFLPNVSAIRLEVAGRIDEPG